MKLLFRINKSPGFVFDHLADMQKFVAVHPVITKIDRTNDDSYIVYETLKIGFIPFSFTYAVTIEPYPMENKITMYITVMKLARVEMTFVLTPDKDFTIAEENIFFKSRLPVKSIMLSIFRKQHGRLFKNIAMANQ